MTQKELSQVYYLDREIKMHQRRLYELREELKKMGVVEGVQGSDDKIPYQKRNHVIRGVGHNAHTESCRRLIYQRKELIADCKAKCEAQKLEIEKFIAGIPDSLTRQIFTYRFVELLSWQQVAQKVGGGNTDDSARKVVTRYFE